MNRQSLMKACMDAANARGVPGSDGISSDPSLLQHLQLNYFFKATNDEMALYLKSDGLENFPVLTWLLCEIQQTCVAEGFKIGHIQRCKEPTDPSFGKSCIVVRHNFVPLPEPNWTAGGHHPNELAWSAMDWEALHQALMTSGKAPKKKAPRKKGIPNHWKGRKTERSLDRSALVNPLQGPVSAELGQLSMVRELLNRRWLERAQEIELMLVSAVAGRHMFFRGPPGTGKTEMLQDFATMVGGSVFDTLLGMNTLREEIEGPIDVPLLTSTGTQRRNRQGCITDCEYAVLDEVWKANSGLLNQLLRIMSQGDYFEAGEVHKAKTRSVFGASNEGPKSDMLEALHSRFMLRSAVDYVSQPDNRRKLLGFDHWDRPEIPESMIGCLSTESLDSIKAEALKMPTDPEFEKSWSKAIAQLRNCKAKRKKTGVVIDDRRARALMEIAKVWSYINGDGAVF